MKSLVDNFLEFVKIHTTSDETSNSVPSTDRQFVLQKLLLEKLNNMGVKNAELTDNGYLYAFIPSNSEIKLQAVGFIAHVDTSPDFSGENVNPVIHENYSGEDIELENDTVIAVDEFPELLKYKGQTIITADGNTLLGADDKAGIAVILSALEQIIFDERIKHGDIYICYTPDEEIGRGADEFDTDKFKADFAYTVDGGEIGELEFENFNAARADIKIFGRNVHPGTAKNKMINALEIAMKLHSMLPVNERPQFTENREGFFHLNDFKGSVEEAEMIYIIRDHDMSLFEKKKSIIKNAVELVKNEYGGNRIELKLKDQYYNMYEKIKPVMHIVDIASEAMRRCGVKPLIKPIRGGTDGARISYMGIPCPNIFTGGHNFHGRYEFIPVQSMEKSVETVYEIVKIISEGRQSEN